MPYNAPFRSAPLDAAGLQAFANVLAANAESVWPETREGYSGFGASFPMSEKGGSFRLLVSDESGLLMAPSDGPDFRWSDQEFLGANLARMGLWGDLTRASGIPAAPDCVGDTLAKLDPSTLELFRGLTSFDPASYNVAASLPADAAFRTFVQRLPMLAAEILNHVHDVATDGEPRQDRVELLEGRDPMGSYCRIVQAFIAKEWPGHQVSDGKIAEVTQSIGRLIADNDPGLQPCHVAFLSFAPHASIPVDPAQLEAALEFIDELAQIFRPGRIGPDFFYAEFAKRFANDWTALEEFSGGLLPAGLAQDVAVAIVSKVAEESDEEIDDIDELPLLTAVADAVRPVLTSGMGFAEHMDRASAFERGNRHAEATRDRIQDEPDMEAEERRETEFAAAREGYAALSASGFFDARFASSATDLAEHLGFSAEDLLDPYHGTTDEADGIDAEEDEEDAEADYGFEDAFTPIRPI